MKKINSKLFNKFELNKDERSAIVGGFYTSSGSDTNSEGGGHDISYDTLDSSGQSTGTDVFGTGSGTRDKPEITQA